MSDDNLLIYKTIFAQTPVSTQIFTPNGETVMVNAAWESFWQIKFAQVKQYNVLKDKQLLKAGIMPYIKRGFKGEIVTVPAIEYIPEKSVPIKGAVASKWVAANMFPIKDSKGDVTYVVLQHEDVTHQKETEDIHARLAAIVASSEDAIVSKTLDGTIQSWNHSAEKLFGYTAKEAIGKHISIIIPKDRLPEEEIIIKNLKQGKRIEHFETIRKRKNGEEIHVSLSISPMKDSKGHIFGASKIARDITQQKRDEQLMRENEERFRLATSAGSIGVWDWDLQSNQLQWTDKVYEIHGVDPKRFDTSLENFRKLIHPEDAKKVHEQLDKALSGKEDFNSIFRIVRPSGEVRWITTSATVIRDTKGIPLRMLGATSDITHEKNLEQERNDFVGIATHELKTPVTSLKAYAEVLQRRFAKHGDMFSSEQLGKMNAQLDKLTTLISDLLDITKIESGKLRMHIEKFDFDTFVLETAEELQRTTERHTIIIEGTTKTFIEADRERAGQVLTNFISNAIKYSPHADKIIIKIAHTKEGVTVCVQDFGVGIPKEKQDKLFQRFYRVTGQKENTFPGIGLGLYISKEIIERQQGKIWVESDAGKGSSFCFMLPLKVKVHNPKTEANIEEIKHD